MARSLRSWLLLAILCAATNAAVAQTGSESSQVVLRPTQYPVNKYFVCLIAKFTYGDLIPLQKGASISARIRERCGYEDAQYLEIFQSIKQNIDNREVDANRELIAKSDASFVFPACLYAQRWIPGLEDRIPVPTYTLKEPMKLKAIAKDFVGASDDQLNDAVQRIYKDNPDTVPRVSDRQTLGDLSVAANTTLKLETLLRPRQFQLDLKQLPRAEFISSLLTASDPETFRRYNKCGSAKEFSIPLRSSDLVAFDATRQPTSDTAVAANTRRVRDTGAPQARLAAIPNDQRPKLPLNYCATRQVEPLPDATTNCNGDESNTYPVDWAALEKALALQKAQSSNRSDVTVVVADTGLLALDDANFPDEFPKTVFRTVKPEEVDGKDVVAMNLSLKSPNERYGSPYYFAKQPDLAHGTHVAGIVLGQGAADRRKLLMEHLKLFIVNVMTEKSTGDTCDRKFFIEPDSVKAAVREMTDLFASQNGGLPIFNMSFEMYSKINQPSGHNHLIVAAAGNAGMDYSQELDVVVTPVYPAHWSANLEGVISVGGHDASRTTAIGNLGADAVHLFAPACKIKSLIDVRHGEAKFDRMTGTSQAAAFVTLAAALVRNLHGLSPEGTKQRLVDSSDFEPALRSASRAGGLLNMAAAVAASFDVIKLRDGTLRIGRITQTKAYACKDGKLKPLLLNTGKLRRISYMYDGDNLVKAYHLHRNQSDVQECTPAAATQTEFANEELEFEDAEIVTEGDNKVVKFRANPIAPTQIKEIVVRHFDSPPSGPTVE